MSTKFLKLQTFSSQLLVLLNILIFVFVNNSSHLLYTVGSYTDNGSINLLTKLSSFSWIIHALFLLAPSHLHDAYSTNHKTPTHSHKLVAVYLNILVFVPLKTAEFHLQTCSCENNEINSLNWWKFSVLAPWSALYKQVFHLEIWDFTNCP